MEIADDQRALPMPKKSRIMMAVKHAAIQPLAHHALDGSAHEKGLVKQHGDVQALRQEPM